MGRSSQRVWNNCVHRVLILSCLDFLSENYAGEGLEEDLRVEKERVMVEIKEVEVETAEHFFHRVGIAVIQRGVRGDTRTNLIQQLVLGIALHDLIDVELALWTGTYKRHVADKNIPQLRQLVEMMLAKELARPGEAAVVVACQKGRTVFLGIGLHAAELQYAKGLTMEANTLLAIDGWPSVVALDDNETIQEQGRKHDKTYGREQYVERAF